MKVLEGAIELLEVFINEWGECDHEVGFCICDDLGRLEAAKDELRQMKQVPDHYQELALRTWHNKDVLLVEQCNHAMLQLAAEAGEIVKLWAKDQYKPGHVLTRNDMLDELGDLWYYMRILAYLFGISIDELTQYNANKLADGHGWNGSNEKVMERMRNK